MNSFIWSKRWLFFEWLIILYGIYLRSVGYICNLPMLWDCYVRFFTIKDFSYLQLLHLGHSIQSRVHDPYGILLIQKLIISSLGNSEYAARLFVLLCGIGSLVLFPRTIRWTVGRYAGIVALILFALSDSLIAYSVAVNAYSSDVLVTLLLYLLFQKMRDTTLGISTIMKYGLAGALSVWFSLPAIFVLGGGFLALSVDAVVQKQTRRMAGYGIVFLCWLASFLVYYFYALAYFVDLLEDHMGWMKHFLPPITDAGLLIPWVKEHFYMMFSSPLGVFPLCGMLLFSLGLYSMFKTKRFQGMVLIFPLVLVVLASVFNKYPYWGRAIIFLAPACYLLIGQGWEFIFARERKYFKPVISLALLFLLFCRPVLSAYQYFYVRPGSNPMTYFLETIKKDLQEGDVVYVHFPFINEFLYYNLRYGIKADQYVLGQECRYSDCYGAIQELKRYKRVWCISHIFTGREMEYLLTALNQIGRLIRLDAHKYRCYLYEINPEAIKSLPGAIRSP